MRGYGRHRFLAAGATLVGEATAPGRLAREYGVWDDTWRLTKRVTFVIDRAGRVRYVEPGSLAIDTSRTLDAVQKLARAK